MMRAIVIISIAVLWGCRLAGAVPVLETPAAEPTLCGPVLRTRLDIVHLHPNTVGHWTAEQRVAADISAFDLWGRVREETYHRVDGTPFSQAVSNYTDDGRLDSRAYVIDDGFANVMRCSYTPDGQLLEEQRFTSDGNPTERTHYNYTAGRLTQVCAYAPGGKLLWQCTPGYDAHGVKTRETFLWPGAEGGKVVRLYNADHRVNEVVTYAPGEKEFSRHYFAYGDDGLCFAETHHEHGVMTRTRYAYQKDHYGNWVTRVALVWTTRNGITIPDESHIEHRSISYADFVAPLRS